MKLLSLGGVIENKESYYIKKHGPHCTLRN